MLYDLTISDHDITLKNVSATRPTFIIEEVPLPTKWSVKQSWAVKEGSQKWEPLTIRIDDLESYEIEHPEFKKFYEYVRTFFNEESVPRLDKFVLKSVEGSDKIETWVIVGRLSNLNWGHLGDPAILEITLDHIKQVKYEQNGHGGVSS